MELNQPSSLGANVLVARKPMVEDAHFDITAMVDLVFMMNIFFLVTWIGAALAEVDLPAARHGVATDVETAVVVTVVAGADNENPAVYVGEVGSGPAYHDLEEVDRQVREAAESGMAAGRDVLLIKAERLVRIRDIARVGGAAGAVEGMKVRVAVMEKE